jgi:hypothetical protein
MNAINFKCYSSTIIYCSDFLGKRCVAIHPSAAMDQNEPLGCRLAKLRSRALDHAAVDAQDLPGNPTAVRTGEERHHIRDVIRLPQATEGNLPSDRGEQFLRCLP